MLEGLLFFLLQHLNAVVQLLYVSFNAHSVSPHCVLGQLGLGLMSREEAIAG